jgi:CRISPR-associated protein Cas6
MLATANNPTSVESSVGSYVELCFGVVGQTLPADHGYRLYGAISRICPELHQYEGVSIQTITGMPDRRGKIHLSQEKSFLRIRLPYDPELISKSLTLAGKRLMIGQYPISLGIPQFFALNPADPLKARIVVIKGFQEAEPFLEAAKYKLSLLGIQASATVPRDEQGIPDRKTITIAKKIEGKDRSFTVVGFGLFVSGLSPEDSIKLQIAGIGGKRRMGCGVFAPMKVF